MEESKVTKSTEKGKVTKTTTRKKTAPKTATKKERTVDDVMPNDRVEINNLCDWSISFVSEETGKEVTIEPHVRKYRRLTVAEIDSQVKVGNIAFCGTDGYGSHAAFQIVDPLIREYVFGEDINPVQLTDEAVQDLLETNSKEEFSDKLSSLAVTESEKRMIAVICADKDTHPGVNIDDAPSYMIAAIEKLSGVDIR